MFRVPDLSVWRGRVDVDDAGDARRVHQVVKAFGANEAPGVALVGFCCDEGVRRNGGRVGAKEGPRAIRCALASMAWHASGMPLLDAGDLLCDDGDLESVQRELEELVRTLLVGGHLPIVIGGGHEVAYGTCGGLLAALPTTKKIGIINIDAHFDLRVASARNSGTSFADLSSRFTLEGRRFSYASIGISESANTGALFARAKSLGVTWYTDEAVRKASQNIFAAIDSFMSSCDDIYLSIDMDAMPSHESPGVSAPAALGIPFDTTFSLVKQVHQSGKLRVVDIAETNPLFDIDNRTSRLAARLVHTIIHAR